LLQPPEYVAQIIDKKIAEADDATIESINTALTELTETIQARDENLEVTEEEAEAVEAEIVIVLEDILDRLDIRAEPETIRKIAHQIATTEEIAEILTAFITADRHEEGTHEQLLYSLTKLLAIKPPRQTVLGRFAVRMHSLFQAPQLNAA
jgi:hypothetical protein